MCKLQAIAHNIYTDIVNIQFAVDNLAIDHKYFFMATILWIYTHDSFDATFDPENITITQLQAMH